MFGSAAGVGAGAAGLDEVAEALPDALAEVCDVAPERPAVADVRLVAETLPCVFTAGLRAIALPRADPSACVLPDVPVFALDAGAASPDGAAGFGADSDGLLGRLASR